MKYKLIIILILFQLIVLPIFGQDVLTINKLESHRLTKILNNVMKISENREGEISVKIYKIDNGSGSAHNETCEVSHNLLIAVSEYDEYPKQNLFEVGPFYNPKIIKLESQERHKLFTVEYGEFDSRKSVKMKVSIDDLAL